MAAKKVLRGAIDVCKTCGGTYTRGKYTEHKNTNQHLRHTAAYKKRRGPL